jgi:hypothetical protein
MIPSEEFVRRRKVRARITVALLLGLVVLIYAITLTRIGGGR